MPLRLAMAMVVLIVVGCDSESRWSEAPRNKNRAEVRALFPDDDSMMKWARQADRNDAARASLPEDVWAASLSVEERVRNGMKWFATEVEYAAADANREVIASFAKGATGADWTDERLWKLMRRTILARFEDFNAGIAAQVALENKLVRGD